jgi:hypothetical protein
MEKLKAYRNEINPSADATVHNDSDDDHVISNKDKDNNILAGDHCLCDTWKLQELAPP